MLDTNEIQLIKRLKSKPRLGMAAAADPLGEVTKALTAVFSAYKDQGGEVIRQNVFGILAGQVQTLNNNLNVLEQLNLTVQSGFNKSTKNAAAFGVQLDAVAKSAGVNATKFKQYAGELRTVFAGQTKFYKDNGKFSQQLAKQSDVIRNQLGVSEEAYRNFVKYQGTAFGRSKDAAQLATNFESVNRELGNVAESVAGFYEGGLTDIIEGMGTLGQATLATFGRMPKELGLAILKSKSLGLELEKITGIGKGFLDIEQSIAAEIEFQILSGEELLTQDGKSLTAEFQKAAFAQDANKQADLLVGFIEKFGEKLKDNVPLQEQAASMLGLTADDLFGAINQYNAAGAISQDIFKTQTADIKDQGKTFSQIAAEEDKRTNETVLSDDATKTYIETLGNYTNKVTGLQKATADLNKTVLDGAADIGESLATNPVVKTAYAGAQSLKTGKDVVNTIKTGTGDNTALQVGQTIVKDVFIPAGGNNVITGPLGSFSLDPKDDIIAMPNAREALANQGSTTPNNTTQGGTDTAALVAALQGMSFHVTNTFDGDKIQSQLTIRQGQRLNA
jgi:hypothetical protein